MWFWSSRVDLAQPRAVIRDVTSDRPPATLWASPTSSPEPTPAKPPAETPVQAARDQPRPARPTTTPTRAVAATSRPPAPPSRAYETQWPSLGPPSESRQARRLPGSGQRPQALPPALAAEPLLKEAETLFQNGKFVEARFRAEKALKAEASPRVYLLLGKILLAGEDYDEAAQSYRRVLQIDRNNAEAKARLEKAVARIKPAP